jgi:hypothetical protein
MQAESDWLAAGRTACGKSRLTPNTLRQRCHGKADAQFDWRLD